MAFLRPYKQRDEADMAHICRATLPPSLEVSEPARRLCAYVWTHQYTHLSPSTCFVLDDGTGKAVGYCIGCPDIPTFCAAYPSYTTSVLDPSPDIRRPADMVNKAPWLLDGAINEDFLAQQAYDPFRLLLEGNDDLDAAGYRATMHIDLLDEWQGKGWGRKLIDMFVGSVKREGVTGIWIGVAGDNAKVVRFYEKMGFRVLEREGKKGITMVRDY